MEYLSVKDLSFSYGDEQVLHDITFDIHDGELYCLTGENGAAKSTLLKNILGLLKPDSGKIIIAKKNRANQPFNIGYLPQQVASFNVGFPSSVYELVASGRYQLGKWFKKLDQEDRDHIRKALDSVGMWDFRKHMIGDLSGGQKQRVCIARIFATDPDLFVLDEPTTGMDQQSRKEFLSLLQHNCHVHHKSALMVTHFDDEVEMADGHLRLERREELPWRCFSMSSCKEPSRLQH